ncbi:MAG: malto-oligosyltrehalose synthase [Gemmataceae bacterium]
MTPITATYRLQLHAGFTFRDARGVVPYLAALGVSHLYLSPILTARPGSQHGYDVTDPSALNPELGTEADFRDLVAACRERGMGVVVDVVPNHMALGPANPWWRDVFEHGPSSPYARYFDIAWDDPPRPDLRGRVMLPVLGKPYYQTLEAGELTLDLADGGFVVRYYDSAFPLDPRTYDRVLKPAADLLVGSAVRTEGGATVRTADPTPEATAELQSILTAIRHLPPRTETDADSVREGRTETDVIKRRVAALVSGQPAVAEAVRQTVAGFGGGPDGWARLDALLDAQAYRLCFWRVASDEINYRRFFDVNVLSALSAEHPEVFEATHALILRLVKEGLIDGLRIDHPDGLFDPKTYLERLQAACPGVPVWVEKILDRTEALPPDWPTAGTTGYDALNAVNGLFVDPAAEPALTRTFREFTGQTDPFPEVVYRKKIQVLTTSFSSELGMLAQQLDRLARHNRKARDFTLNGLRRALRQVVACFPVYRSYLVDGVSDDEVKRVRLAVRRARLRAATLSPALFDFIRDTLLQVPPDGVADPTGYAEEQRRFAGKFEQVTAPVTAKGVEDTAFYTFTRLVSLNEVGGDPGRVGWEPAEVHRFFADRQAHHPLALNTGSTHDTKRGEDVRARINALSEFADEWRDAVARWAALNRRHRTELEDGFSAPDPADEYLLYQTLLGAWPADADTPDELAVFADRVKQYMRKAIHEAKVHTSWINPTPEYDAAVQEFVGKALDPATGSEFLADLARFHRRILRAGVVDGLAQSVVRCTAPGVPDTYQGTELWDLSLVDPDNRRPVDYRCRERLLAELDRTEFTADLLNDPADGRAKLYVVSRLLRLRHERRELFAAGEYVPLQASGPLAGHVFAFERRLGDRRAVVLVPRLAGRMAADRWPVGPAVWGDTMLPLAPGAWTNAITGDRVLSAGDGVAVGRLLDTAPVAGLLTD